MFEQFQTRMVGDWREFSRWWSVRMMAIGGLLGGVLTAMPSMPPEVQALIPVPYRVAAVAVWSVASIVSRVVKQRPPGA